MIQQRTQPLPLIDKRYNAGALRPVMHLPARRENRFEILRNPADLLLHQSGKVEKAESLKKLELLLAESH